MDEFPKDFFWGAATSSYQIEGNNSNSDWWQWEENGYAKESSGNACRSYELYEEDFSLAKKFNHNAHRLSIEWSRVEPKKGEFSQEAIVHYQELILSLKKLNIEPVVTLHHFSNPIWFAEEGGWQDKRAPAYFLRYAEKIVNALSGLVRFWVTINEPLVYAYHAYVLGVWPPQLKSALSAKRVIDNFVSAHIRAYKLIHSIYKRNNSSVYVSIAKNMQAFVPCIPNLRNRIAASFRDHLYNYYILNKLSGSRSLDFIGINYYSRSRVEARNWLPQELLFGVCKEERHSSLKKNSLGWEVYPQGLFDILLKLKRFDLPLFILENGICTDDDSLRWDFIKQHLQVLLSAINRGIKVSGYLYWSLIDNYEWDKGFGPRFGLVDIDYSNFKRTPRDSAYKFAEVCKKGTL